MIRRRGVRCALNLFVLVSIADCGSRGREHLIVDIGACQRLLSASQANRSPLAVARCLGEHCRWSGDAITWAGAYVQLENRCAALAVFETERIANIRSMAADLQALNQQLAASSARVAPLRQRAERLGRMRRCLDDARARGTSTALRWLSGPEPQAVVAGLSAEEEAELTSHQRMAALLGQLRTVTDSIPHVLDDSLTSLQRLLAPDSVQLAALPSP